MKKFKIFLAIAIAAIATVAAGFYSYQATQENLLAQEQELLFDENLEALSCFEAIGEWWNRLDYVCNSITCYDLAIGRYNSTMFQKVEDGKGDIAHWYNCATGCFINSLRSY